MFPHAKHICDTFLPCCIVLVQVLPPNSIYPLLLQCFIIWKFENMYFRTTRVIALATRYTVLHGIVRLSHGTNTNNWRKQQQNVTFRLISNMCSHFIKPKVLVLVYSLASGHQFFQQSWLTQQPQPVTVILQHALFIFILWLLPLLSEIATN